LATLLSDYKIEAHEGSSIVSHFDDKTNVHGPQDPQPLPSAHMYNVEEGSNLRMHRVRVRRSSVCPAKTSHATTTTHTTTKTTEDTTTSTGSTSIATACTDPRIQPTQPSAQQWTNAGCDDVWGQMVDFVKSQPPITTDPEESWLWTAVQWLSLGNETNGVWGFVREQW
jgi:hypothetical protein